jgi:hypothetical protein
MHIFSNTCWIPTVLSILWILEGRKDERKRERKGGREGRRRKKER